MQLAKSAWIPRLRAQNRKFCSMLTVAGVSEKIVTYLLRGGAHVGELGVNCFLLWLIGNYHHVVMDSVGAGSHRDPESQLLTSEVGTPLRLIWTTEWVPETLESFLPCPPVPQDRLLPCLSLSS